MWRKWLFTTRKVGKNFSAAIDFMKQVVKNVSKYEFLRPPEESLLTQQALSPEVCRCRVKNFLSVKIAILFITYVSLSNSRWRSRGSIISVNTFPSHLGKELCGFFHTRLFFNLWKNTTTKQFFSDKNFSVENNKKNFCSDINSINAIWRRSYIGDQMCYGN